ncbi:MAG: hypothetical protein CDV28_10280 [Candidatus Electronema aureum]|uniref:Uncharacterized protein n=1 Tax=Candidatus Electronema aureum TaxID=2005002 RepID=A0A521G4K8_9BACT|nr:MAG: hypothetical protein CDV28_10280 [Candidatus Electronema aureum]
MNVILMHRCYTYKTFDKADMFDTCSTRNRYKINRKNQYYCSCTSNEHQAESFFNAILMLITRFLNVPSVLHECKINNINCKIQYY